MSAVIIGAVIGLLVGGLRGLVIGAVVAYVISLAVNRVLRDGLGAMQAQFLDSTFAVMGALSKADSVVTRDEINTAERIFSRLRLTVPQREAAKASFKRGKSAEFDLDEELTKLSGIARGRAFLLQMFLQIQCMAVAPDGVVHPAEHRMLVGAARRLGLTERDVAQLEALLRAGAAGPSSAGAPGRDKGSTLPTRRSASAPRRAMPTSRRCIGGS